MTCPTASCTFFESLAKYSESRLRLKRGSPIPQLACSVGRLVASPSPAPGARPKGLNNPLALRGFLLLLLFSASPALADDAAVLPKGRSSVSLENLFYFPTESRWNPHGNPEKVAAFGNELLLKGSVFGLTGAAGAATFGTSFLRFKYDFNILDFSAAYGVTDRLTLGIDIPYYWAQNRVKFFVSPQGATPGLALTTEQVQQVLTRGLTVAGVPVPGFGFKRIQSFSADGLGDITAVAKYQYFRNDDWRLAASGGVRFPTGRQDDPDDLTDVSWSSGAYALLLRFHHDYVVSNLWKEKSAAATSGISQPGDLILDLTFRYDWVLPDQATVRIGSSPVVPLSQRERVNRDLGDRFEIEFTSKYEVLRGLSVSALYKYGWKLEDRITGHKTFPTRVLEKDTDSTEQIFIVRGTYSLLPLYLEKKFPIPLNLTVSYRDRFAGSGPRNAASPSQYLKTRYISFGVSMPF